jgi:hypothetical protein
MFVHIGSFLPEGYDIHELLTKGIHARPNFGRDKTFLTAQI